MKAAKVLASVGFLTMSAALAHGFLVADFPAAGRVLLSLPWGVISLIDVYIMFALFSGWVIFREASLWGAVGWSALILVFGALTASLYLFPATVGSRGDWQRFWFGRRVVGRP
ncbi:MAG: DUF1475 family protein [Chloroflexi bacterium]|nr:DUF1475 family protein [Chloroflexota bacterium]